MPIRKNHEIKVLLPPEIHSPRHVVSPQRQRPAMTARSASSRRPSRDILDGGIRHEQRIQLVRRYVVLEILPRHVVRHERPVREARVREGHGDFGHIGTTRRECMCEWEREAGYEGGIRLT